MTIEQVSENNKLIADFMGVPKCDRCADCGNYKYGAGIYYAPELMLYHKDWNWIMPVFIKIMQLGKEEYGVQWSCEINEQMVLMNGNKSADFKSCHFYGKNELTVHSLYTTIVDFIHWYNQTKTEHEK